MTKFILAHLDDDPLELKQFSRTLNKEKDSFLVHSFTHSHNFLKFITDSPTIDFCILDIRLSEKEHQDGLSLIQSIKTLHPDCVVIISSFYDETSWILKALSLQADDFFSKKHLFENISERLIQLHHHTQIKNGNLNISSVFSAPNSHFNQNIFSKCAGKTFKLIEYRVKQILKSEVRCVAIEGESGTGKEVVVDLFEHYKNTKGNFIRLNCGALSQNLLESELFGYKKGAFTGALQDTIGFIESAHNGFLFLDEISSLPFNAQSTLLRVIENQEIVRLGETQPRKINVRFLCASNVSLHELVTKNCFRRDLWQRLREVDIYLPPLYERKDEIPDLLDFFCSQFREQHYILDPLAKKVLCEFDWREGNVRELRNTLRAMTEFSENGILGVRSIPKRLLAQIQNNHKNSVSKINLNFSKDEKMSTYQELCDELLNLMIQHNIKKTGKLNISQLAKELNISRTTLQSKIKNATRTIPLP